MLDPTRKKQRATFTKQSRPNLKRQRYILTSLTNAVFYRCMADPEGPGHGETYKCVSVGEWISGNEIDSATDGVEYTIKNSAD